MSLYSHEEICEGCTKAVFHECCSKFCHCEDNHEQSTNGYDGTCEYREIKGE